MGSERHLRGRCLLLMLVGVLPGHSAGSFPSGSSGLVTNDSRSPAALGKENGPRSSESDFFFPGNPHDFNVGRRLQMFIYILKVIAGVRGTGKNVKRKRDRRGQ